MAAFSVAVIVLLGNVQTGRAQISKGNRILLDRGIQLQGLVQGADIFTLSKYTNANYTSINWGFTSYPSDMGAPPGVPWSRWVSDTNNMPPQNGEDSYTNQLVALQLGDEWNISDGPTRTNLINWFVSVRTNWPNTILYHNNYVGQASDDALGDFIPKAQPDMLFFDLYPFQSVWDANASNHIGTTIGGPPTSFYTELRRYRAWAFGANIPFGTYMQTFHAVQDYDAHVYRNPSASELRLDNSAALAFNAKMLTGFVYNAGATSLFDIETNGYSGDTHTNALYFEQMDANRRAMNLGKALVCLKPVYDLHNATNANPPPGPVSGDPAFPDGYVTSIMFLQGRIISGGVTNATPLPGSFAADPQEQTNPANPNNLIYSWWEFGKNDPYMSGWGVTNKAGIKNSGLPGEVFIAWFTPLDESFDGTNFSNEIYMMVVNGLTDTNGTAADCMQEIHLDFNSPVPSSVVMLDPETGLLQTNLMTLVGSKRRLTLDLNGGDAALFKFADNAPFVGNVVPSRPQLSLTMQSGNPAITVQGSIGGHYQLQAATSLPATNWTTLTNVFLPTSPYAYLDTRASKTGSTIYRVVGTQ